MAKKDYESCLLQPEIVNIGSYQTFTIKNKDRRGYDYVARLLPVSKETVPGDIPETADTDRLELFVGGSPDDIEKVSGEIEVSLGKENETYSINEAALVYIPKGLPVRHRIIREPEKTAFLLSFNLTPRWEGFPEEKVERAVSGKKYEDLILRNPVTPPFAEINSSFMSPKDDFFKHISGATANFALYYVKRGGMFPEPPHWHRTEEILMFMSSDPHDMENLGATVEVGFGPEWEKISFSNSCFVRFPAELEHGPFNIHIGKFKRPFLFGHYWPTGEPAHIILSGETEELDIVNPGEA